MPLEPNDDPTSTINFLQRLTMLSTMETYALAAGAVAAAYAAARSCGPDDNPTTPKGTAPHTEGQFRAFQQFRRLSVAGLALGLAADYVVAAQLYACVRDDLPLIVVAELFATSFASAWAARTCLRPAIERSLGLRGACGLALVCVSISAITAALHGSRHGHHIYLLAGRVCSGIAQPLLQLTFEGWQRAVHAHQSWPALWRRETMRAIGRWTTLAALLSGALSEVLYRLCDDRRAPLLMSAAVALVAAGLTVSTADAPVLGEAPLCGGDAEAGLGRFFEFPRDTSGGRSVRGAVVTAGAAIVDAAAAIALVAWAPTVSRADPDAPFGFVFSLTMAAAVAGTQVFGAVAASSKRFEHLAAACCATGGLAFAFLATQPAGLGAALAPFLAFQLALGAAKPCLAALRGKHVAPDQRDVAARAQAACATIASVVGALLYAGHAPIVFAACALACAMASSPLMRLTA